MVMSYAPVRNGLFVSFLPRFLLVIVSSLFWSAANGSPQALAESTGYRSGERFVEHPPIEVPTFLSDGDDVVSPGRYLVRVRAGRILLADAELRQVQLRAPCKMSISKKSYQQPEVTLTKLGRRWQIRYVYRAWVCGVLLDEVELPKSKPSNDIDRTALKKRRRAVSSGVYDEPDSYELVTRVLERRALDLKPCLLRAERRGHRLTSEELSKCMCSMSKSWRLPQPEKPLEIALRVVPFPFGLAFEATPSGKRNKCRGWIGRGPVQSGVEVGGLWLEVMDEGYRP